MRKPIALIVQKDTTLKDKLNNVLVNVTYRYVLIVNKLYLILLI